MALLVPDEVKTALETKPQNRIVVFVDFDGTFVRGTPTGHHILVDNLQVITATCCAMCSYYEMDAEVMIVTGRAESLTAAITKFVQSEMAKHLPGGMAPDVIVHARPTCQSINNHKTQTVLRELQTNKFMTVVHFEDDRNVINDVSALVKAKGIRYLGHLMMNDKLNRIITDPTRAIVVTLVQGPASGKSTILTAVQSHYESNGHLVVYVSPDCVTQEWRNEQKETGGDPRIPSEIMFKRLMSKFFKGVSSGAIVIVDMCHDNYNMLKIIKSSDAAVVMGSFIKIAEVKGKKGPIKVVHPEYLTFVKANAASRVAAKTAGNHEAMNGSTLDSEEAISKVVDNKTTGCVFQVVGRGIKQYDPNPETPPMTLSEATKLVLADVDAALKSSNAVTSVVNAYVGVPVKLKGLALRDGFRAVVDPHITMVAPTSNLDAQVDAIGRRLTYEMTDVIETPNTVTHHVRLSPDDIGSSLHITRLVRDNHKPFEAKNEIVKVDLSGQAYTSSFGFGVFL